MYKLESIDKKKLIQLLNDIELKGLTKDGKKTVMFDQAILSFEGDNTVISHGLINRGLGHYYEYQLKYDTKKPCKLIIESISDWKNYLKDLSGNLIDIEFDDQDIKIISNKNFSFYKIKAIMENSIHQEYSFTDNDIFMSNNNGNIEVKKDNYPSIDKYNEYKFNPTKFIEVTNTSKTIKNISTNFKFSKSISLTIGDYSPVVSNQSKTFTSNDVEEVELVKGKTNGEFDTVESFNSIIDLLHSKKATECHIYYHSNNNPLYIKATKDEDVLLFLVNPITPESESNSAYTEEDDLDDDFDLNDIDDKESEDESDEDEDEFDDNLDDDDDEIYDEDDVDLDNDDI